MFRRPTRRPLFETLSARQTMAGDVTVAIVNHELVIGGDDLANSIEISYSPIFGSLNIQGVATQNASGVVSPTRVNGGASVSVSNHVFNGNIRILMQGGNDTVELNGQLDSTGDYIARDMIFEMGAGDDTLDLINFGVADDLLINTGAGNDRTELFFFQIGEFGFDNNHNDLTINTAAGADLVALQLGGAAGNIAVDTGIGGTKSFTPSGLQFSADDDVLLEGVGCGRSISVKTGDGRDDVIFSSVGAALGVTIETGDGNDTVSIDMEISESKRITDGNLLINLGAGTDELEIATDVTVGGTKTILDA